MTKNKKRPEKLELKTSGDKENSRPAPKSPIGSAKQFFKNVKKTLRGAPSPKLQKKKAPAEVNN